VNKSTAITPQTTTRKRRAVARKNNVFCDANGSRPSIGTSTTDKKTIPPIQLTAATRWSHMRRDASIIARRYSVERPWIKDGVWLNSD